MSAISCPGFTSRRICSDIELNPVSDDLRTNPAETSIVITAAISIQTLQYSTAALRFCIATTATRATKSTVPSLTAKGPKANFTTSSSG